MDELVGSVLARLYGPGIGPAPMRSWPRVVGVIRRSGESAELTEVLARAGLSFEALLVRDASTDRTPEPFQGLATAVESDVAGLWPLAGAIARGRSVDPLAVSLDAPSLPPALWRSGDLGAGSRATIAGIGSRELSPEARRFARTVGDLSRRRGIRLVSGGAEGADDAFAAGHGACVALLPHGLDVPRTLAGIAGRVSVFPRPAPFSRERAMRRNALIVAAADLTVVASVRLREGGSWHAAVGALRRRAPLAVYIGEGSGSGARALVALGALPVRDAEEALAALDLLRTLGPDADPVARWAELRGAPDGRAQTPLSFV